jgi:adenosine deaminase CECR1
MEDYMKAREQLIASERALRSDSKRVASASDLERRADAIVRKIRAHEAKTIWHSQHEDQSALLRGQLCLVTRGFYVSDAL